MSLPRILIVDDQYGEARQGGRNRPREDFCFRLGIQDITKDANAEKLMKPIAEAVFCRGQKLVGKNIQNDVLGTLDKIREGWRKSPRWAMLFLDLHFKTGRLMSDGEPCGHDRDRDPSHYFGLTLLEHIWNDPEINNIPIVVLSSMDRSSIENRFSSRTSSVAEFIDKTELDQKRFTQVLWDHGLLASSKIVGNSLPLLMCLKEARKRARLGCDNILLLGETGTGKELMARYVHESSVRKDQQYITVYTQGVPDTLVEDILFGHEKGAFSGAGAARAGAAENANGGTLFIDEFGDVPATTQSKLLRLLDKNIRETQRLGADKPSKVDLQIILATNHLELLDSDDFRHDLLYRVKADEPVVIPPLRDRAEDIPLLSKFFVRKYEQQFKESMETETRKITMEAMEMLCSHRWPGNVRQLERVIESAIYRWPKLRSLSAAHLAMPEDRLDEGLSEKNTALKPFFKPDFPKHPNKQQVLEVIDSISFDPSNPTSWTGFAPDLQRSFSRAQARLLRAALIATKKPTVANPSGEVKIHPAVKLFLGNGNMKASPAADAIKRILAPISDELDGELLEAYRIALRLRPKSGSKRNKK